MRKRGKEEWNEEGAQGLLAKVYREGALLGYLCRASEFPI